MATTTHPPFGNQVNGRSTVYNANDDRGASQEAVHPYPNSLAQRHNRESRAPSSASSLNKVTATDSRSPSMQRRSIPKSWGRPPTPPHKEDPQYSSDAASVSTKRESYAGPDSDSIYTHMRSRNISRANSVYSISRVSFTNQITQLTSIHLPVASSLSSSIEAIPTAPKAAHALSDAADQIQAWIVKASEVLDGLDARDDVEWAAQAGRDGLGEVDGAISKFDSLIQVYVTAVDNLQKREDAVHLQDKELTRVVTELERIVEEWQKIKNNLNSVKRQVELAIEWEELRSRTFEEITKECDKLSREIFEMEEQRHKLDSEMHTEPAIGIDLTELEALVENKTGSPTTQKRLSHRYNFPKHATSLTQSEGLQSPTALLGEEDTNLLGLFARMQPLRTSLDFVPVRIANFQNNAKGIFPTACGELDDQRESLEEQWQKLSADAESLKRELGEDRWLLVFRNAGKQALRMIDSVERSITKLDEALDSNTQLRHAPGTLKKIENYEAKKLHYCPAIERVIGIVDRGVKDRLTVNGEIVRLQNDVQSKWKTTLMDVKNMDSTLEYFDATKTQELRDSVSSIMSTDRSFLSSHLDSMGSSPPSSVGVPSRGQSRPPPSESTPSTLPIHGNRSRQPSTSTTASVSTPASKRFSSLPVPTSKQPKTPVSRSSAHESTRSPSSLSPSSPRSSPRTAPHSSSPAPRPASQLSKQSPSASSSNKPKWNASTSLNKTAIGHNFRPMAVTEPSPYRKVVTPVKYTPPGATRRQSTLNASTPGSTTHSRRTSATYSTPGSVVGSPSPSLHPRSASRARRPSSLLLNSSEVSEEPLTPGSTVVDVESPTSTITQASTRPITSMASRSTSRMSSLPQQKASSGSTGPRSRVTSAGTVGTGNSKTANLSARPGLNKKKSDLFGAGGR